MTENVWIKAVMETKTEHIVERTVTEDRAEPATGKPVAEAKTDSVTVEEFENMLWEAAAKRRTEGEEAAAESTFPETAGEALRKMSLSSGSLTAPLLRKNAAEILHRFLREVLREPDEEDWAAAAKLKDLYDCSVCVNHIAQMYVKGIMPAVTLQEPSDSQEGHMSDEQKVADAPHIFGTMYAVGREEAKDFLIRLFDREKRTPVIASEKEPSAVTELTAEKAIPLQASLPARLLVDVRSEREYAENHLPGAINLPLAKIIKNPYVLGADLYADIFLYCEEGYQSRIAANCAAEAGYRKLAYFANKTI